MYMYHGYLPGIENLGLRLIMVQSTVGNSNSKSPKPRGGRGDPKNGGAGKSLISSLFLCKITRIVSSGFLFLSNKQCKRPRALAGLQSAAAFS